MDQCMCELYCSGRWIVSDFHDTYALEGDKNTDWGKAEEILIEEIGYDC